MTIDSSTEGVPYPAEGTNSLAVAASELVGQYQEGPLPLAAPPLEPHDETPRRIGNFDDRPDTPEHDDAFREALRELEAMPGSTRPKLELLLPALGEKPASMVEFDFVNWTYGETEPPLDDAKYQQLLGIARGLGLHVRAIEQTTSVTKELQRTIDAMPNMSPDTREKLEARMSKGAMQKNRDLLVSRSVEVLDELEAALSDPTRSQYDQRLGVILGFPPTATRAYVEGRTISPKEARIQDPATLAFAQFRVSPENAEVELETAQRWAQSVKEVSPAIYDEVMNGR